MIEVEAFSIGLSRIAVAVRETIDAPTFAVYHEAIGTKTTPEQWARFTMSYVQGPATSPDGRARFPTLVELLDALRQFQGEKPIEVEADEAYKRVFAAANYTANGGSSWNYRDVLTRCGQAAADAFAAAGGDEAFATTWAADKRRERFFQAYQREVRRDGSTRLLREANPPLRLIAGEAPSKDEAAKLLRFVEQKTKQGDE
jgi:hypothetical protein